MANDAGSGGAGNPTGGSGGSAAGGAASGGQSGGGVSGSGGAAGGAGGSLPEGGLAGGVFFSVDYGAKGLAGTGVASARSSAAAIFASNGSGPGHVAGTNVLGVTAAQLGLLDTDDLNDIAVLKPAPAHPLYHFSIATDADGAGFTHTDVDRSSLAGELPGDVFVSDGVGQHYDGEIGHRPGFNALTIDEAELGLSTVPGSDAGAGSSDDLDALELGVTGVPSKIYFTVAKSAMGAADSPLAATAGPERGCTIFESTLNGTHKKTYSCANLGLSAGDEVDALAVYGASTPQQILFSVKIGAVGGAGTAVATEVANAEAGGDIFRSTGAGTNELLVDEAGLGLNATDELDALAVTEKELTPRFDYAVGSCGPLTPDPRSDVSGSLAYNANWHAWLSTGIFVIGRAPLSTSGSVELLAYDVSTCAQVGNALALDLAYDGGLSLAKPLAVIPRAGWSKAAPFANVEIWGVTESAGASLVRLAAAGGPPVQIVRLSPGVFSTIDMVYRKASDDFAILFAGSSGKQIAFEKRPAANAATAALPSIYPVPFPCEEYTGFMGYDPASNGIEIAHNNTGGKRICSLDSALWFREPPRPWLEGPTPDGGGVPPFRNAYEGFIVPGTGMFGIETPSTFDLVNLRPVP